MLCDAPMFHVVGLIAVLALANQLWATLQCAEIGFAFAAFLSYMEAYILEKWCIYCVVSQALITAILLCTIIALVLQHRAKKRNGVRAAVMVA